MFCQQCGAKIEDGMRFCQHCGAPVPGTGAPTPAPAPVQAALAQSAAPIYHTPATLHKSLARGPLFLTATIAFTCTILLSVVGAAQSGAWLGRLASYLYASPELRYGLDDGAWQALNLLQRASSGGSIVSTLLGQLPAIAIAVGLWMLFAAAMDRTPAPMPGAGLTVVKIVAVIQAVMLGLGGALVLIVLLMVTLALSDALPSDASSVTTVMAVLMIIVVVVLALAVLYYVKLVQTINTIRANLAAPAPSDAISAYVAVMCFLSGGVSAIAALGSLFSPLSMLNGACAATASICFGVFLFSYRGKVRQYAAGSMAVQPVYAAPAPAAPAAPAPAQPVPAAQPSVLPTLSSMPVMPMAPKMDTVVMQETSLLEDAPPTMPTARLLHMRTNRMTVIDQPRLRIGKDPTENDLCISDNTAVSRRHADILYHDGAFYVVDLRSTNHVYINDQQIPVDTQTPLPSGAILRLGDESFRFELG